MYRIALVCLSLVVLIFGSCGCDSGEGIEDAGVAEIQSVNDSGTQPDAMMTPEINAALYPECTAFQKDDIVRVYAFSPVGADRYLSIFYWIDFPDWADFDLTSPGKCWAQSPGVGEIRCELKNSKGAPARGYKGTVVMPIVGTTLLPDGDQVAWYCPPGEDCLFSLVLCVGNWGIGRKDPGQPAVGNLVISGEKSDPVITIQAVN